MDRIETLPPDIELALLLQRCAARDAQSFRILYDKTSPLLFARLMRMLRQSSAAQQVLQDVYVRIWERAAQFEAHRGQPLAWMMTITRYCAIDCMRRAAPLTDETSAETSEACAAEPRGTEKPHHFDACIGQLSEDARRCLTLAFVEGRSRDEIARLTTRPLDSVKSGIRRGLLSLKQCLGGEGQTA